MVTKRKKKSVKKIQIQTEADLRAMKATKEEETATTTE